jgi:hypothetical protein
MVPLKSQPVASEFRIRVKKYRSIIKYTNETTYFVLQPPSPPFPNTIGSSGALSLNSSQVVVAAEIGAQ